MWIAVLVILLLLCGALALRVYTAERDIRDCARQLRQQPGSPVRMTAPNRSAEELLAAVNDLVRLKSEEQSEAFRQKNAIRQQISNISHDLRTPLTSIIGYIQLLEGDRLTSEERKEYLGIVKSRSESLQSLITGFYDLSRLEGGEYPLVRVPVDLYQPLSTLVAEFYNDFAAAGFAMDVYLERGLPLVEADPGGVLRIFTNLIRNALEHGRQQISISLRSEGDKLETSFANDAGDLNEEDIQHVFDRFFTADKMRTGRSTGLGLAIVKALTEQMGHQVTACLRDGMFVITVLWRTGSAAFVYKDGACQPEKNRVK